jgi:hypothetical protein
VDPQHESIGRLIKQVRSRLRVRIALKGMAIELSATIASLILASIAASQLTQHSAALAVLRAWPFAVALTSAWLFIIKPLTAKVPDVQIARLIEEKYRLKDALVTAVEFSETAGAASPAIITRLLKGTDKLVRSIRPDEVTDPRRTLAYTLSSVLSLLTLIVLLTAGPPSISGGMSVLYWPSGDSAQASTTFINVSPGNARVPRGSDQKIKAALNGFDSETAQIFIRKLDSDRWQASQMEPAKNHGEFLYVIFNIQDSLVYYIESGGIRSPEFTLEIADLPFVKRIDLVLNFPAYTRSGSKKIEDGGEVAALKGTVVNITAHLSGKAKAARIVFDDGSRIEMAAGPDNQFTGQFIVSRNGTYRIEITSEDGERYYGSNEYDVEVIEDHPPVVFIEKPGRDMKVTSVQEVFAQVRAEDDYGVASIELYYSINGGQEQRISLQSIKGELPHSLSGAYTFFLEEFNLKPGDFISYYAKARDNAQEATSDIYFLEVRPFDREFRQAQQMGGGGGDQDSNALTRRQREIIAATFRVQREQSRYGAQEREENYDTIALSQEKLKSDTDALAERIRRRLGDRLNVESDFGKLAEYLSQAAHNMEAALDQLRARKAKEALAPEQRALQQLLRAEALFREIQVAQGGAGSDRSRSQEQELADLFELQLDKMKNQYETIQREQQASRDQKQDEIARRLQELARRQQQQIEQQMRGNGASARGRQDTIEEARRLARELERLSRERRDERLQESAQQLQQAADELERAQASSSSRSSSGAAETIARGLRALEYLEQARRSVERVHRVDQQQLKDLRQRAQEALRRQDEITRAVDELSRVTNSGSDGYSKRQQLAQRKQALADQIAGLEKDIDQTARGLSQQKQQSADRLRAAASAIRRNRIPDRIRQTGQMVENGWYEQARDRERVIRSNIEEVIKELQAAENSAGRLNRGEGLEEALNRARELADSLESLRRRLEDSPGQSAQNQSMQGQSARPRQGMSRSTTDRNQSYRQQGAGKQSSESYSQSANADAEETPRGGGPPRGSRQLESELRQAINEAEELRRQLRGSRELTPSVDRVIEQLRRLDPNVFSDPNGLALLKNEVIDPLRQLELELVRRLQARLGKNGPGALAEGEAPDRYRKMVEDYYRRLSARSP